MTFLSMVFVARVFSTSICIKSAPGVVARLLWPLYLPAFVDASVGGASALTYSCLCIGDDLQDEGLKISVVTFHPSDL